MADKRVLIAGDLAAMVLFAFVGIASHEKDISLTIFARSFLPFAVAWVTLGFALGAFRTERPSLRLLAVYLVCGVAALLARSVIFDRELLNAFFVIALMGNGLLIFAWRWLRTGFWPGAERPGA
jgi:uncharacterized membrane protein